MLPSTSKSVEVNENSEEPIELEENVIVVTGDEIQAEIAVVDGEEVIFADDDEYIEYDPLSIANDRNAVYDIYQPHESENGTFMCKICMRTGKNTEYEDRSTFVAHRYKCHGSFNNNVMCPLGDCREVFASLYTLRRHLSQQHELPIEIHLQSFVNIGEFEKFRHLVELASGCRFMMHTKQPKYRRQVMHCSKSEHKLVLQTQKHRLPRERMLKEGSACPSVISYRVESSSGEVHTFMQLYHIGHAPDTESQNSNADNARPMDIVFPIKPACWANHPMQYVQIDVHEMPTSIYGNKIYDNILIVTCLKTRFLWAKPLFECTRTAIGRILNSIFNEYGVPEGFSTSFSPTYIRDTIKSLESVYAVEIREVWNEPLPYNCLERWVLELAQNELGTRNRWVEQLQFLVMEYNQKPIPDRMETPFERMFNRKAPNLYHNGDNQEIIHDKYISYHSELRNEEEGVENRLNTSFEPGRKVFLRKGITKPRRGNNTQYYFGYIGEVDPSNPYYPFKVHYTSSDSPWPSERNIYAWVSVFDLLPTIHEISEMSMTSKKVSIAGLLCSCMGIESSQKYDLTAMGDIARESSRCLLFRNCLCTNQMSRFCCKLVGREHCRFHSVYPENDESYAKMDAALSSFIAYNKDSSKEAEKDLQDSTPIEQILNEVGRRRLESEITVEDPEDLAPPILEPMEPTERHLDTEEEEEEPNQIPMASEHIDIEGVDEEEIMEHSVNAISEEILFEYADDKRDDGPSTPKRGRRRKSPSESAGKKKKLSNNDEFVESTVSRRSSARRTIRPKNLDDYVE
ncbi:C2H2-type domain-containing protein [Caenorhabditis elegans]|uniref:C2H2-type domain-containing protein n=1 Tax=Caenorhabditis elegans TaxID=6239 RepID=B9ZSG9_CAEEL|nr:C2H2-type domain-containing protein [Caenorhabditis elegans]CCD69963.2 C2H2-type domain-containing protein [Caenorhabditis elegans]